MAPEDNRSYSYSDRMDVRIKILKIVGVVVLLGISMSALIITSSNQSLWPGLNTTDHVHVEDNRPMNLTQTLCDLIEVFDLSDNILATVCRIGGHVRIDFRRFINNRATIQGIHLSLKQWHVLESVLNRIDKTITHFSQ